MRSVGGRRIALAALLCLGALGCGLNVSGTDNGTDGAAPAETANADGSYASSSGGGSSGGESSGGVDGTVSSDDGSIVADVHASRDSASDAGVVSNDANDGSGPCQTLAACCATLMSSGANLQGCLQAAEDGGATACETTLALLQSLLLCL